MECVFSGSTVTVQSLHDGSVLSHTSAVTSGGSVHDSLASGSRFSFDGYGGTPGASADITSTSVGRVLTADSSSTVLPTAVISLHHEELLLTHSPGVWYC